MKADRTEIRTDAQERTNAIERIPVRAGSGSYVVAYGSGLIARAAEWMGASDAKPSAKSRLKQEGADVTGIFVLTSPRVARHWQAKLLRGIGAKNVRSVVRFDDREAMKNMATVEGICRRLVREGADRRALLVAIGGGVVGDVSGYAAASYLRGVRLIHVPTTLVAQVDSAIGGKTGVNLPEGKNLVGAFYPPHLVLADPDTLRTLSDREFRSGIYEVLKYGVIGDTALFAYLERTMPELLRRERPALDFTIPRCIRAKADVVGRDERESGLREILNFGHTFAHAFETATAYRRYLHGEAVGWGMIAAARLAAAIGMLAPTESLRIERLVRRIGPLPPLPRAAPQRLIEIMGTDKKTRGGKLRFVLPDRIGTVRTVPDVPLQNVRTTLRDLHLAAE